MVFRLLLKSAGGEEIERRTGWCVGENTFGSFYPSLWTPRSLYVAAIHYLSTMLVPLKLHPTILANIYLILRLSGIDALRVTYLHITYTYSQRGIARVTADSASM